MQNGKPYLINRTKVDYLCFFSTHLWNMFHVQMICQSKTLISPVDVPDSSLRTGRWISEVSTCNMWQKQGLFSRDYRFWVTQTCVHAEELWLTTCLINFQISIPWCSMSRKSMSGFVQLRPFASDVSVKKNILWWLIHHLWWFFHHLWWFTHLFDGSFSIDDGSFNMYDGSFTIYDGSFTIYDGSFTISDSELMI